MADHPTASADLAATVALAASRISTLLRLAADAWRAWSARRCDDAAFASLDAHALRDLGLSRSEVESFRFEAESLVVRTRLRVAHGGAGHQAPIGRGRPSGLRSKDWEVPNRSLADRREGRTLRPFGVARLDRFPLPEA